MSNLTTKQKIGAAIKMRMEAEGKNKWHLRKVIGGANPASATSLNGILNGDKAYTVDTLLAIYDELGMTFHVPK